MSKPILFVGHPHDVQSHYLRRALGYAGIPLSLCSFSSSLQPVIGQQVTIPVSDDALKAWTGKTNLHNQRGSIFHSPSLGLVIPTLPPSVVQKSPNWYPRIISDLKRALKYVYETYTPKNHKYLSHPNREDIETFVQDVLIENKHHGRGFYGLSIDIETNPKAGELLCVGFALNAYDSICIKWNAHRWQNEAIRVLCNTDIPKILQNGQYDCYWLAQESCPVRNWTWDTLYMHHALAPTEPHDLAFLTSIYTEEPYYKDEAQEDLWTYNCKDDCVTWEIAEVLHGILQEKGMLDFFLHHYSELFHPLLDMMLGGIRVDNEIRARRFKELLDEIAGLRMKVNAATGEEIYAKKAISSVKLRHYLYETLGLPKRYTRQKDPTKTPSLSTDEITVRTFTNRYPKKFGVVGNLILDSRRSQQLSTFYQPTRPDPDGYSRFSLKLNTEAGRLSSSETPKGTGLNIQNQDRECRDMYVPDPGHIFLEFDLSQAESRVVYCLSGNKKLIEEAQMMPWEYDHHTENAAKIFGVSVSEVTKAQRHVGKIISHGSQRDMQAFRLQATLLKAGYIRTVEECEEGLANYHTSHPGVREYFAWVRSKVMAHRALVNSWGRMIEWPYEYLDDSLYRKAYSWGPQSEVADLINRKGLIPLAKWLEDRIQRLEVGQARIVCQVHDSILVSVEPLFAWQVYEFVNKSLDYPLHLRGTRLVIPVEAKIGRSWEGDHEFKKPASREEFEEEIRKL